jgi:hypothetical protein
MALFILIHFRRKAREQLRLLRMISKLRSGGGWSLETMPNIPQSSHKLDSLANCQESKVRSEYLQLDFALGSYELQNNSHSQILSFLLLKYYADNVSLHSPPFYFLKDHISAAAQRCVGVCSAQALRRRLSAPQSFLLRSLSESIS